jgi:GTP-binding protein HflX
MALRDHTVSVEQEPERVLLVGLNLGSGVRHRTTDQLDELEQLADSAGASVVGRVIQNRRRADPAYLIGRGKAEEIAETVRTMDIVSVIFDDDLSPVQARNLERIFTCKVLDRSALILDIFASRARTREAKTQVELAQLQYLLPRLTRQWTHLSKQYGGIGTKGPGETQIETDRRAIRSRLSTLSSKLHEIARERSEQRKGRERYRRVSLVGYTNAGKSTLLNWFTGAGVAVEDRLFATLDATVRLVSIPPSHEMLLSDTVGFIRKLPHHLVASFQSTLDEVREADILLHVVDVSHPLFEEQRQVVNETLEELGAGGKPTITVFNKIDRLEDRSILTPLLAVHPDAVCISAARSINMTALVERLGLLLEPATQEEVVTLAYSDYPVIAQLHELGTVLEKRYGKGTVTVRMRMDRRNAGRLRQLLARQAPPGGPKEKKRRRGGAR